MPSTFAQIETLKQQLAEVSAHLAEVKSRSWDTEKEVIGAKLRAGYYRLALMLRRPEKEYAMWSTGVLTVGPAAAMLIAFLGSMIIGLPGGLIFWVVVLGAAITFAFLSVMLGYPGTEVLPKLIADERFVSQTAQSNASQLALEVSTLRKQQVAVKAAIKELIDEDHRTRTRLLKRDWKPMRGDEWKLYIGEVCAALGADVEQPGSSEARVDYVVSYGNMRIAVVARGNVVAVTNKDVQAAVTAKKLLDCDRATVITNSRLANSAVEEAQGTGCILIDVKQFPAFVMGSNLELFR
ncbi:MAG: restriction endonuclease [Pirellulaceae bacterium]|nr:restriction endonuclease [Pirellulaceae bacterium]